MVDKLDATDVNIFLRLLETKSLSEHDVETKRTGNKAEALLAVFHERRGIARTCEFSHLPGIRVTLDRPLFAGQVEKVRHGVYRLTSQVPDSVSFDRDYLLTPRQRALISALSVPRTISELRLILGASRQAVAQALGRLAEMGLVGRSTIPQQGVACEYHRILCTNVEGEVLADGSFRYGPIVSTMPLVNPCERTRAGSRTEEILSAVGRKPGSSASDLLAMISAPFDNKRSIYVALAALERRGLIQRRCANVDCHYRWWPT